MTFKTVWAACLVLLCLCTACSTEDNISQVTITQQPLLRALADLGYDVQGNTLTVDQRVKTAKTLDLRHRGLTSLQGIEAFTGLEELRIDSNALTTLDVSALHQLRHLSLTGNADLHEIIGLSPMAQPALRHLALPYSLRLTCGVLPAFCKEMQTAHTDFIAQIEVDTVQHAMEPYTYYYIFQDTQLSNNFYRLLGEENFLVVSHKGKQTEAIDKSVPLPLDHNTPLDLVIETDNVKRYDDVEAMLNVILKFSHIHLRSLLMTTYEPKDIAKDINLDLRGYTQLQSIKIDNVPLASLQVDSCTALQSLEINRTMAGFALSRQHSITTLSALDAPALHRLILRYAPLEKIKLTPGIALDTLVIDSIKYADWGTIKGDKIRHLSIRQVPSLHTLPVLGEDLQYIDLSETQLQHLDISKATKLNERLRLDRNAQLATVDFPTTQGQSCKLIEIYENALQHIDLSAYTYIKNLSLVNYASPHGKYGKSIEAGLKTLTLAPTQTLLQSLAGREMLIAADAAFMRTSPTIKALFLEKPAEAKLTIYKYGPLVLYGKVYDKYYQNNGSVTAADFD